MPRAVALLLLLALPSLAAQRAPAEPLALVLDPDATEIRFTLGALLHTVHGSFALLDGTLRFDPETGEASGRVRVDAQSGTTGIGRRDRNMHEGVLASARHPRIVLRVERIEVRTRDEASLSGVAHGTLELRGERHPLAVPFSARREDGRGVVQASFTVPYVAWGLPDPSTFLLPVDKSIDVEVTTAGELGPAR